MTFIVRFTFVVSIVFLVLGLVVLKNKNAQLQDAVNAEVVK